MDAIREALRNDRSTSMVRRRRIALLAALGLADFALISLYQTGVIRHLPDLPGRLFDSDQVNASHKAYAWGLPDGTTGAMLYALTLMLATAGGTRATGRPPFLSLVMGGVVGVGVVGALDYLRDMVFEQRRVCLYCVTGAALNLGMGAIAAREVGEALRELRGA
ncbi:MAG: hypothetical protein M9894_20625 [Planctomycetes bacterium]|nr:hypothetical protein [Planctomycetota bacterium]